MWHAVLTAAGVHLGAFLDCGGWGEGDLEAGGGNGVVLGEEGWVEGGAADEVEGVGGGLDYFWVNSSLLLPLIKVIFYANFYFSPLTIHNHFYTLWMWFHHKPTLPHHPNWPNQRHHKLTIIPLTQQLPLHHLQIPHTPKHLNQCHCPSQSLPHFWHI